MYTQTCLNVRRRAKDATRYILLVSGERVVLWYATRAGKRQQKVRTAAQRSAEQSRVLVSGHFLIGEKKAPRKGPVVIARSGYDQRLIGGYLT